MPKAKNLSQADRVNLLHYLLERVVGDTLARGALTEAHLFFGYSKSTVSTLGKKWNARRAESIDGTWDVTSGKTSNGRPIKYSWDELQQSVLDMRCRRRRTVRSLASGLEISKSQLHRM